MGADEKNNRADNRRRIIMKKIVTVVRKGNYRSWVPGKIVFEGTDEECLKYIYDNLKPGEHMYLDYVRKEVRDDS